MSKPLTGKQKAELEPWMRRIPVMFRPPKGLPLTRVMVDFKVAFPDDRAARWMLGLLTTANDLSISFKMWAPFLISKYPKDETYILYQASHMTYFMRLVMAQVFEGWTLFNRGMNSKDGVVAAAIADSKVQELLAEIRAALATRFTDSSHKPASLLKRCRVATFHYYDDEGDSWPEQLEIISSEPMIIVPKAAEGMRGPKGSETRYIVADEWINSRLGPAGFHSNDMHKTLEPVVFKMLKLIERTAIAYLKVRGIHQLSATYVDPPAPRKRKSPARNAS